jgi:heme-degrading monooxygenase HmoA
MESVVLNNPFEVPEGQDEAILAAWREANDDMQRQEGFVSTRLHASHDPRARFRFVNVAVWRSPEHFRRAVDSDEFRRIAGQIPFRSHPALYQVIAE